MPAIEIIRLIGAEFSEVDEDTILKWIELVKPMVSKKQFGDLYEQAIAYLVCHKLKMSGNGQNPLGEIGAIGVGFSISSVSEGGTSVSFGAGQKIGRAHV